MLLHFSKYTRLDVQAGIFCYEFKAMAYVWSCLKPWQSHVINKTMGFSKVNFTLSVDADTDVDLLAKIINDTGAKLAEDPKWKAKITEAPRFMNVGSFSQLGMDITIVGVTQPSEQWSVTGELRRRLLKELVKHKIQLAAATPWSVPPKKR